MPANISIDLPGASAAALSEQRIRTALWIISLLCAVSLFFYVGTMFWAQHEFSEVESIVGIQALMLHDHGTLYYDLNRYPYTVCAYTPIFYCVEAVLTGIGIPVPLAGRLISLTGLLGLFYLCWRLVILYSGNRYASWTAVLLASSAALVCDWGTVGQVDTVAICFAMAAFYQFSLYYVRDEPLLWWAGIFALLAFFTKQTAVAAPAAIFVLLWLRNWRIALRFGVLLGAAITVLGITLNLALHNRFFPSTLLANMNPFVWGKLKAQMAYAVSIIPLLAVFIAGAGRMARSRSGAILVYLAFAVAVFFVTAPKIGSDINYQIETTLLLAVSASIGLDELGFFPLCFARSKVWITLLQLPLLLHLFLNYRISLGSLVLRTRVERLFRSEAISLAPYLGGSQDRVICSEMDPLTRFRRRIELEPVIYLLLTQAKVVDPEPVRSDIEHSVFKTIVLYQDIFHGEQKLDIEIPSLPAVQLAEMRKHYRLVNQLSGPYLTLYVYQPLGGVLASGVPK